MNDLLSELEAVVEDIGCGDLNDSECLALANRLNRLHAEIAAAVRDAARWRALHWGDAPMVTVTGAQLARGIKPGDYAVPWDWPITAKTKIRLIAQEAKAHD